MKRFPAVLSTLFLLALFAVPVHAGGWEQREIGWFKSSVGSPTSATAAFIRDTTYNVFGGTVTTSGTLDTTAVFSPTEGVPFKIGDRAAAATGITDSLAVGYLVFMTDSSTAVAGGMSSVGIIFDGRAATASSSTSGYTVSSSAGWTQVDSLSVGCANGASTVVFPVPLSLNQRIAGNFSQSILAFAHLRARPVAGVGAMPACRVFWRYWKP